MKQEISFNNKSVLVNLVARFAPDCWPNDYGSWAVHRIQVPAEKMLVFHENFDSKSG